MVRFGPMASTILDTVRPTIGSLQTLAMHAGTPWTVPALPTVTGRESVHRTTMELVLSGGMSRLQHLSLSATFWADNAWPSRLPAAAPMPLTHVALGGDFTGAGAIPSHVWDRLTPQTLQHLKLNVALFESSRLVDHHGAVATHPAVPCRRPESRARHVAQPGAARPSGRPPDRRESHTPVHYSRLRGPPAAAAGRAGVVHPRVDADEPSAAAATIHVPADPLEVRYHQHPVGIVMAGLRELYALATDWLEIVVAEANNFESIVTAHRRAGLLATAVDDMLEWTASSRTASVRQRPEGRTATTPRGAGVPHRGPQRRSTANGRGSERHTDDAQIAAPEPGDASAGRSPTADEPLYIPPR